MYNLRIPEQRARYRRATFRRRDSHFAASTRIIQAYFRSERSIMISALPKVGKPDRKALELAFKRIWTMVGSDSWKYSEETWGAVQSGKPKTKPKAIMTMYLHYKQIPTWFQYVNDYIDTDGGEKIIEITNHTRQMVKAALKEGIANDESIPVLSKRISDLYDGFEGSRSVTIARSETVDAFNQASLAQAKDAGSTLDLIWIATMDDRTRPEHEDMDGTQVPYDSEFDCADGTTMPGEAVNCRCTIGYVVPEGG